MANKIFKTALINALSTTIYIIIVSLFLFNINHNSNNGPDQIIIPIAMLLLFVLSASITGFLIFGRPILWYLDGKKKESLSLLLTTIIIFFIITLIALFILVNVYLYH